MDFNKHSALQGMHSFLSASKYHWVNYDDQKLLDTWRTSQAAARGTALHAFAADAIKLGIKLPRSAQTLNLYVNDAIGFKMTPEQVLFYSPNCFCTADAISFRRSKLRVHDLKTGSSPVSMTQLEIYAAVFCLEYGHRPGEIEIELRIYKDDEVLVHEPETERIAYIMDKIVAFDRLINSMRSEEE